eukprot:3480535-Alexandrium_andersonii.AAC.1
MLLRGANPEEDGKVGHALRPRNGVVQEVAILHPVLLLRNVEVGVGPVELGGALPAAEGVQLKVQR